MSSPESLAPFHLSRSTGSKSKNTESLRSDPAFRASCDRVLAYVAHYWPHLIRENQHDHDMLIGLPRPYLVPSHGTMFQEMYYWDSYFMAQGLVGTEYEQLILDMTENLAHLFMRFRVIPNASRYRYLSRSQPPFFTQLIWLAYEMKRRRGDADALDFLGRMMVTAEQEHTTVWLGTAFPHERLVYTGLSRYFDTDYCDNQVSCESGWDHSTRCADRWLDHLPVDLNAILYARERDFARAATIMGRYAQAEQWQMRADTRAEIMRQLMWDEQRGFFFDYDWKRQCRNRHLSLAGFYPMWAGLATPVQAERIVRDWLPVFEKRGGLVTTLRRRVGRQWAYPNGWAPLQWLVVAGLEEYGYTSEARRIMAKWCVTCATVFDMTGTMWEKYNVVAMRSAPEGGLYGSVAGFGWSNAVFADFARRLGLASR
jgi:alpha,alpha-trehalase